MSCRSAWHCEVAENCLIQQNTVQNGKVAWHQAALLFALPRTVPVLAAVPERLTAVVEQPVEAASSEAVLPPEETEAEPETEGAAE